MPSGRKGLADQDAGTVAGSLGLALLAGLALPRQYGLWAPVLALLLAALLSEYLGRRRAALLQASEATPGTQGRQAAAARPGLVHRVTLALPLVLATVVVATVAARAASSIVVAYPAAIWGLMAGAFGGLMLTLLPSMRGRWVLTLIVASLVPMAGIAGQRWEDAGTQSRGWAYSGGILGIHPFQATAVVVDGYGPHDIPINDYVEPDGARGYGPDELAAALQNSIRAIGRLHYADGPVRARMAFENVRVVVGTHEALREKLDREPFEPLVSRLQFFSGTTGQSSSLSFVCPGQREDPRGLLPDTVSNPMCPSKYITEASAGISVTARWTGYTEARGQERFGLARQFLGGTRTDDKQGAAVVEREIRWGAWLVLIGIGLVALPRPDPDSAQRGLVALSGALGLSALLVTLWLVLSLPGSVVVQWIESAPSWDVAPLWERLRAWTPALAVAAIAVTSPQQVGAGRFGAVPLALGIVTSTTVLATGPWLLPDLYTNAAGEVAFDRFIAGAADLLWTHGIGLSSWTVQELEAAVAAGVAALIAGAALALVSAWGRAMDPAPGHTGRDFGRPIAVVLAIGAAAFVVVSRKTLGGSALLPSAMALLLVYGSGTGVFAGRRAPPPIRALAVLGDRARRVTWIVDAGIHLALVGLAGVCLYAAGQQLPSHPFVTACLGLGVAACVGALALLVPMPGSADSRAAGPPAEGG